MPTIVEVPGIGEVEFPDGMNDDAIAQAIKANMQPQQPARRSAGQELKRQAGLGARYIADAAAALPLAALEGGAGVANLVTGGDYSPTRQWSQGMDKILPRPESLIEKGAGMVVGALAGSRIPMPKGAAPANFKPVQTPAQQTLAMAQREGYVVPPTTANPTALNKTLEGVAGKLTTAQAASAKNQGVTNRLAARAIGLPEDQPITLEAIDGVRRTAGKAYESVRAAGRITTDNKYNVALANITKQYRGAAKDFPELAKSDVDDIVAGLSKKDFDADSAVDLIAILRDKADVAFRAGDKQLGKAYRDGSKALEGVIERNLTAQGEPAAKVLADFRQARQLIAKTYSVENAFNQATGAVSATKLGQQLTKGKPLSGDLANAARFSQAFPKAAREFNESLPGISPLDFYATGGVTALTQQPWYLLYPFVRQGVRNALLSKPGQALATPGGPVDPRTAAGIGNALLVGQQ